jgi:hypothetical protein
MITALVTILYTFLTIAAASFVAYWLGVGREQHNTRRWARRAIQNENIAKILAAANDEHRLRIHALEDGARPLSDAEARYFEQIVRKAGE